MAFLFIYLSINFFGGRVWIQYRNIENIQAYHFKEVLLWPDALMSVEGKREVRGRQMKRENLEERIWWRNCVSHTVSRR